MFCESYDVELYDQEEEERLMMQIYEEFEEEATWIKEEKGNELTKCSLRYEM